MKEVVEKRFESLFPGILTIITIGLISAAIVSGQASAGEMPTQSISNENYKIGPGDILDVVVSKNDALTRTGLRVSNQGTIQLAMLDNDVSAACLNERQLADMIKEKYRKYLVDPYVNVSVREFNSNPVAVIGAVNSPGRFQLQRQIRLVELLTFVNGPSDKAGNTIEIMRTSNRPYCEDMRFIMPKEGSEALLSINLSDAVKGGDQSNPVIVAGDIIRVVQADQMNAYIQGNVKSSLAINLKEPVTLTQAIAMAGGVTSGAQIDRVTIRRQIQGSVNRDPIVVNVKEINQQKRDDILLQANDIIDIPGPTGGKKIFQNIMNGLVPSLIRLPMGVIPY